MLIVSFLRTIPPRASKSFTLSPSPLLSYSFLPHPSSIHIPVLGIQLAKVS
ncbi:hypothetical protein HMPREF9134_00742 [Porphyromonas catoniae F0037]|uniref:Uncharacterized protein n=1 Tax=Porphyromonas catoniae F0037 TaxID=1127696 RepID=L1NF86_9PORP|nr:hypothetical protein HMPREF9134_00742 [Porphyromonas catoniae F0037]